MVLEQLLQSLSQTRPDGGLLTAAAGFPLPTSWAMRRPASCLLQAATGLHLTGLLAAGGPL